MPERFASYPRATLTFDRGKVRNQRPKGLAEVLIAMPPEVLWPTLSNPATVASCIPGAVLTKSGEGDIYQGTMRVKFGPTVAVFRGEAKLAYDHPGRRCYVLNDRKGKATG